MDKEKVKAYKKAGRETQKEEIKAYQRAYYESFRINAIKCTLINESFHINGVKVM